MSLKSRARLTKARGFTLIETLIALVVLTMGLLGAAAMLLESLRSQSDSLRRVAAANLLRDMAERIRADPSAATDLAEFKQRAQVFLPGEIGAAVVFAPAIGPAALDRFVITLSWRDPRADEDASVRLQMLALPVAG